jgi:hypothetical protein
VNVISRQSASRINGFFTDFFGYGFGVSGGPVGGSRLSALQPGTHQNNRQDDQAQNQKNVIAFHAFSGK